MIMSCDTFVSTMILNEKNVGDDKHFIKNGAGSSWRFYVNSDAQNVFKQLTEYDVGTKFNNSQRLNGHFILSTVVPTYSLSHSAY